MFHDFRKNVSFFALDKYCHLPLCLCLMEPKRNTSTVIVLYQKQAILLSHFFQKMTAVLPGKKKQIVISDQMMKKFSFQSDEGLSWNRCCLDKKGNSNFFFQGFFHKEAKNGSIVELFGFFFVPPVFAQSYFLAILGNFLSTFFGPISCLRKNVWP